MNSYEERMKKVLDLIKKDMELINPKELLMSMTESTKKKTTAKKTKKTPTKKINYVSIEPATNGVIIEVSRSEDYETEKIVCATTDAAITCLENLITDIRCQ